MSQSILMEETHGVKINYQRGEKGQRKIGGYATLIERNGAKTEYWERGNE